MLCDHDQRETRDHLLFYCEFATQCWGLLNINWADNPRIHDRITAARQDANNEFFMDIFQIGAWEIWKLRNAVIFDAEQGSFQAWKRRVREQFHLQSLRFREDKRLLFIQWLETIL